MGTLKEKLMEIRDIREALSDQPATQSTKECKFIYMVQTDIYISDMFMYELNVKSFQALSRV